MSELTKPLLEKMNDMQEVVSFALQDVKQYGITAAEAGISVDEGLSLTIRMNEVETLEHHNDRSFSITVYKEHCKGSASTSDLSKEAIQMAVKKAASIASYTASDEFAGLADEALMAKTIPDLDLYHPWDIPIDELIEKARLAEQAAFQFDSRISNSEGATVNTHSGAIVYGNSHGFVGGFPSTRHSLVCTVIAEEQGMQRDYWYDVARDNSGLESPSDIGKRAAQRTISRLHAHKLSTRRSPVIFAPEPARSLLGSFISAINGAAIYRKSSFLLEKVGEQVFPAFIRIYEQPHLTKALGSAPFDGEGVATCERDIIQEGVLQQYVLDSYAARKLGMETTGNAGGVRNVQLDVEKSYSQRDLIKNMGTGFLVTELMGHGVNLVTGDYSQGAAGFWIDKGEIQHAVDEVTIAGQLNKMFMDIAELGNDIDQRGNIRSGSILIKDMMIAGN